MNQLMHVCMILFIMGSDVLFGIPHLFIIFLDHEINEIRLLFPTTWVTTCISAWYVQEIGDCFNWYGLIIMFPQCHEYSLHVASYYIINNTSFISKIIQPFSSVHQLLQVILNNTPHLISTCQYSHYCDSIMVVRACARIILA